MNLIFNGLKARAVMALLVLNVCGAAARADVINDWNAVTQAVLNAEDQRDGLPYYALVHVAMYDAVNAIDGRFSVFAVRPAAAARGASKEAAAAAAAYRVLLGVFPRQAPLLATAYAASLAALPNDNGIPQGVALGEDVAAAWLELRVSGGRAPLLPRLFGGGALGSAADGYAEGFLAVRAEGALRDGDPRQTAPRALIGETVLFYNETAATFFARNLRDLAAARSLPVETNARLFAAVYVTQSGAMIACREPKSLGCLGGAFADALRHFFGTSYVDVTLTSATSGVAPRAFKNTHDLSREIATASDDALAGQDVARWVAKNHFKLVSHG
jgi:hypothetical protein